MGEHSGVFVVGKQGAKRADCLKWAPCYNALSTGVAVDKKWYSYFVVTERSADPADSAAPQRVSDVVPETGEEATFSRPANASIDLGAVYQAAKIGAPAHGYTVLKVADMLQSEHIRTLPADVKRKSVMVALDAAGVKVAEIVEDAVRRDRALDTYERVLLKSLEDLRAQTAAENQRIEEEITQRVSELRARIDENNKKTKSEQDDFLAWQTRKHQEEEAIATAVSYFVSESPITTTRIAKDQGDADVR
jgi:hypothetical protein